MIFKARRRNIKKEPVQSDASMDEAAQDEEVRCLKMHVYAEAKGHFQI